MIGWRLCFVKDDDQVSDQIDSADFEFVIPLLAATVRGSGSHYVPMRD